MQEKLFEFIYTLLLKQEINSSSIANETLSIFYIQISIYSITITLTLFPDFILIDPEFINNKIKYNGKPIII